MYDLTVIIPTFKEESNIGTIIEIVEAVFSRNAINGEILVVDDNSPDGPLNWSGNYRKQNRISASLSELQIPGSPSRSSKDSARLNRMSFL